MSIEFENLKVKVGIVIEKRQIVLPTKKAAEYEAGTYNPYFVLCDRDGELICIWCGNKKFVRQFKDNKMVRVYTDKEIYRFRARDEGYDSDEWNDMTLAVWKFYDMKL